jgi:hypothetical protein
MSEENSLLVRYLGDEDISPEFASMFPAFQGLRWSVHSWEHCAELMRRVVEDSQERERIAAAGLDHVRSRLSAEAAGKRILEILG